MRGIRNSACPGQHSFGQRQSSGGGNAALMGPLGHARQRQRTGCTTRRGSPHPGTSARQSSERPASRAMRLLRVWRSVWPVQAKTDASRVATSKNLPFRGVDSRACGCLARYPPELPAPQGDEIRVKRGLDFIAQETISPLGCRLGLDLCNRTTQGM